MTAKEYLQQVRRLDVLIDRKNEQLRDLRFRVTSTTVSYGGERVSGSSNQDKLGDTVSKIVDLRDEVNDDINRFLKLKKEVMETIDSLEIAEMIDLLYRRYLRYEKWEKIAYEMNYSIRGVHKLHKRALIKIDEKIKCAR